MASDLETVKVALRYPWDDGQAGVTLVIGGILTLLSPLLVPGVLVLGYGLRVVEAVVDDREGLPPFSPWGDLFVAGLKGVVVLLVYVGLPLLVWGAILAAVAAAAGFRFPGGVPSFAGGPAAGGLVLVLFFLLAGLFLVVTYLAPAALVNLARSRRLRSAVAFDDVRALASAPEYGSAWLVALAVFALAGVVLAVLNTAAIGVIVSGFVTFYAFVAMAFLYATGSVDAGVDADREDEAADAG